MRTTARYAIAVFSLVFHIRNANAQIVNNDSLAVPKKYRYYSVTATSGVNISFPHKTNGLINVSFPYTTSKDGTTTTGSFNAQQQDLRFPKRCYYLPLALEIGNDKNFLNCGVAFNQAGANTSAGYGCIVFLNGRKTDRNKNFADKPFILKCSINVYYEAGNLSNKLGTIDNVSRTINALGLFLDSVVTIVHKTKSSSYTDTYKGKYLDVYLRQKTLAVLPLISFGNNPFKTGHSNAQKPNTNKNSKAKLTWELSVGYNIDIYNYAGISFIQDDGNGHASPDTKIVRTADLTVSYNGKKVSRTPYNFSGLYLSFAIKIGQSMIK